MNNTVRMNVTDIAQRVNDGEITSTHAITEHLEQIALKNPELNAITQTLQDQALEMAAKLDRSSQKLPLKGVPFTVKENIDVFGTATTQGIPALKNAMPTRNAPIVDRLISAGAVPIARTNLPEFAMRLCTDNPLHGATLNPWNEYLTPGGSSGGDAVAIATGMTPLGIGNDTGGSLRSPAYCCGVAALKPTLGRIPTVRSIAPKQLGIAMQLMQVDGPMARSIHDLRVSYQIMSGRHIEDPRSVDAPLVGAASKKQVGLVIDAPHVETPESTRTALHQAAEYLKQQGYNVTPVQLPELSQVNQLWERLFTKDVSEMLRNLQPMLSRPVHLFLADMARLCPPDLNYQTLFIERARLQTLWSEFFQSFDAVLTPTWTQLPWPVDADLEPDFGMQLLHDTTPFLTPANVLGLPAVAMPMGISGGLPTGIQVMADLWREDLCLEVAETIERGVSFPWLFKV